MNLEKFWEESMEKYENEHGDIDSPEKVTEAILFAINEAYKKGKNE